MYVFSLCVGCGSCRECFEVYVHFHYWIYVVNLYYLLKNAFYRSDTKLAMFDHVPSTHGVILPVKVYTNSHIASPFACYLFLKVVIDVNFPFIIIIIETG